MAREARAIKRSIQSSPRKMRIVLDQIRGKRVPEALSILHFTPNHASDVAEKTLRSAISNFQMNPDNARFDVDDLYVRECSADGGPVLKRISPAPMGRAYRIRKRSNHLTIIVGDSPTPRIAAKPTRGSKKKDVARTTPSTKQVSADNKQ
jgi:large subunit ribosomal protein L22